MAPGDFLPSESDLATQFGMSNKSVRQGLDILVGEGLIRKIPRVGNQVTEAPSEAEDTITLGINHSLERDIALSSLLARFRSLHPGIRVNTITIAGNSRNFIKEYSESGLLDVCMINHQFFQNLVESRLLPTLEPLDVIPGTYRFLEESFTVDGVLYGQPLFFSPLVLCYNKQHFREEGLSEPDSSWTWHDCLDNARKLTKRGDRYGFLFYELSQNRWPAFLLQSGMAFERNRDGVCDIAGTPMLASIRLFKQIVQDRGLFPKLLSESSDDIAQLFENGKVSMILTSYMSMNELKHSDLVYDISPLPYMHEPRTLTVAIGACIRKSSANKRGARLLIDFLGSEAGQMMIRRETLTLPSLKTAAEAPLEDGLNRPSRFDLFRDILPLMRFQRDLNLTTTGFGMLWSILKQYGSDLIDDETLCWLIREQLSEHVREKTERAH
ncbi:MAG: regulatory protein GntR [Paenibacillus sp.]|nr:regulatory protein GntR [Paenibacillus sp.]